MVAFSCCSYAANKAASVVLPGRSDIVSAAGALVIGLLGNVYSRVVGGTAFTSMVTGVLFLVPVSLSLWLDAPFFHISFSLELRKAVASPKLIILPLNNTPVDSPWLFA